MPLRALPNDILAIVLEKAIRYRGGGKIDFGHCLRLLAVCQRWRYLALPLVYAEAFIRCNSWPVRRDYSSDEEVDLAEDSDSPCLNGNLGLIASANCTSIVKRVRIVAHYVVNPLPVLAAVVSQMKQAGAHWMRVDILTISSRGESSRDYNGDLVGTAQPIVNELLELLPNVHRCELRDLFSCAAIDKVYTLLAAGYSECLRVYDGCLMPLSSCYAFKQLERVTLSLWNAPGVRPRTIDVGRLQHLDIRFLQPAQSWDMFFGDDSNSQTIVFPELTSLDIYYSEQSDGGASQQPMQLHFPKLRSMSVSCRTAACPFLRQAVFPARVARFRLHASADLLSMLDDVKMPEMDSVDVALDREQFRPAVLAPVARFMSRLRGRKQRVLKIDCPWASHMLEHLDSANLTLLVLKQTAGFEVVVSILNQLRGLQELALNIVKTSHIQAVSFTPPLGSQVPLDPLNTSLRALSFTFEDQQWEKGTSAALYLLMCLPNLAKFTARRLVAQPVLDAAQEHVPLYPHLRDAASVLVCNY